MTQIDTSPLAWLEAYAEARREAGLRRALRPRPAVATELDLASNDYLGLSQHPQVIEGGVDALRTWGAGATGSRLVTGNTSLHEELESGLAEFVGAAAGLVFSSGYTANLGAVVGLSGPGSLLVSDALSHASLVDACRLSRARVVVTPHRDVDAVDAALAARPRSAPSSSPSRCSPPTAPWPRCGSCTRCAAGTGRCSSSTRLTGWACAASADAGCCMSWVWRARPTW